MKDKKYIDDCIFEFKVKNIDFVMSFDETYELQQLLYNIILSKVKEFEGE